MRTTAWPRRAEPLSPRARPLIRTSPVWRRLQLLRRQRPTWPNAKFRLATSETIVCRADPFQPSRPITYSATLHGKQQQASRNQVAIRCVQGRISQQTAPRPFSPREACPSGPTSRELRVCVTGPRQPVRHALDQGLARDVGGELPAVGDVSRLGAVPAQRLGSNGGAHRGEAALNVVMSIHGCTIGGGLPIVHWSGTWNGSSFLANSVPL